MEEERRTKCTTKCPALRPKKMQFHLMKIGGCPFAVALPNPALRNQPEAEFSRAKNFVLTYLLVVIPHLMRDPGICASQSRLWIPAYAGMT